MKFELRPVQDSDHEWLCELHNDPIVLRNITNPQPITMESHMEWWNRIKNSTSEERMIFCVDGERAGFTKFYRLDRNNRNCELGADLHLSFRGRKLAKHMWTCMLDRCFNFHGFHRVSLFVAEYNSIARHTYESLGFKEEGRLNESLHRDGVFFDQIVMFMLESDFRGER